MIVESRGNHHAVGDNGDSVGLFQLNKNGEGKNLSQAEKEDPSTNAHVALSYFCHFRHCRNPGRLAAMAQRARNPQQYARLVNNMLPEARRLLAADLK